MTVIKYFLLQQKKKAGERIASKIGYIDIRYLYDWHPRFIKKLTKD